MEQFLLGLFQDQLSKFIVGFRKENVNANLLSGKGEIQNVELNCSFLNEELGRMAPYCEFERVFVSKIGFQVPWTNIRKAPIIIDIENIRARAVEPLRFLDRKHRKEIKQMMHSDLIQMIKAGMATKFGGSQYGLLDRITDNLTIEIGSIVFEYQTAGKFKTRRRGPWTPPEIHVRFDGIRVAAVDSFGQEARPKEVWQHNQYRGLQSFLLYRKISMELQIFICPSHSDPISLLTREDNRVEILVAAERRRKDGALLKVQADITVMQLGMDIPAKAVPILAHAVAGLSFCFSKDRSFVDPLKGNRNDDQETLNDEYLSDDIEMDAWSADSGEAVDEVLYHDSSSDDDCGSTDNGSAESIGQQSGTDDKDDYPILLIPDGIVIHEKFTISLAVNRLLVLGAYSKAGCVDLQANGIVAELIWPREDRTKGGYVQASVAFVSITELHENGKQSLLVGGIPFDGSTHDKNAMKPLTDGGRDVTFPLFEDRSVRPDPLRLRHTFPAQAVGLKTTIEVMNQGISSSFEPTEQVRFLNEIGIEKIKIFADAFAWTRIVEFALYVEGGGFDQRWYTGDWGDFLTRDMLVNPREPLNLRDHVQPTKQLFLDDNQFVSSELFNVTARIKECLMRIPADIKNDLKACDILVTLEELMPVVSSALPQTFLSGKVGSAVLGEDGHGIIEFPNDPNDIAYDMMKAKDRTKLRNCSEPKIESSTFRMQITLRGFGVRLEPVVPYCMVEDLKTLLAPVELSILACIECLPPKGTKEKTVDLTGFISAQVHRIDTNFNLSLLSSAIGTATFHASAATSITQRLRSCFDFTEHSELSGNRFRRSLRGRRVSVRRHLPRSRVTGCSNISVVLQVARVSVILWKEESRSTCLSKSTLTEALRICCLELHVIEVGWESATERKQQRETMKVCIEKIEILLCSEDTCDQLLTVVSVGGDESIDGLTMRGERFVGIDIPLSSLAVNIDGYSITFRFAALEYAVLLILEALLSSTSARNHMSLGKDRFGIFPSRSVGALLSSFQTVETVVDTLEDIAESENQDVGFGALGRIVGNLLPEECSALVSYVRLQNGQLRLPAKEKPTFATLAFHKTEAIASYDVNEGVESFRPILDTYCRRGAKWLSTLSFKRDGLWYWFESNQSLRMIRDGNCCACFVPPFKTVIKKEDSTFHFDLLEGFRLGDTQELSHLVNILLHGGAEYESLLSSCERVLSALNSVEGGDSISEQANNPVGRSCFETSSLLEEARILIQRVEDAAATHFNESRQKFQRLQENNQKLRELVFRKEREYFSVTSYLLADFSGWLRWGAAERSGNRGLFSSLLWTHWLVLRRSLLVVYRDPASFEPVNIISLTGASLIQLQGGARKRDVKRAFALTDGNGSIHFISASTDREYREWTDRLNVAISSHTKASDQAARFQDLDHGTTGQLHDSRNISGSEQEGSYPKVRSATSGSSLASDSPSQKARSGFGMKRLLWRRRSETTRGRSKAKSGEMSLANNNPSAREQPMENDHTLLHRKRWTMVCAEIRGETGDEGNFENPKNNNRETTTFFKSYKADTGPTSTPKRGMIGRLGNVVWGRRVSKSYAETYDKPSSTHTLSDVDTTQHKQDEQIQAEDPFQVHKQIWSKVCQEIRLGGSGEKHRVELVERNLDSTEAVVEESYDELAVGVVSAPPPRRGVIGRLGAAMWGRRVSTTDADTNDRQSSLSDVGMTQLNEDEQCQSDDPLQVHKRKWSKVCQEIRLGGSGEKQSDGSVETNLDSIAPVVEKLNNELAVSVVSDPLPRRGVIGRLGTTVLGRRDSCAIQKEEFGLELSTGAEMEKQREQEYSNPREAEAVSQGRQSEDEIYVESMRLHRDKWSAVCDQIQCKHTADSHNNGKVRMSISPFTPTGTPPKRGVIGRLGAAVWGRKALSETSYTSLPPCEIDSLQELEKIKADDKDNSVHTRGVHDSLRSYDLLEESESSYDTNLQSGTEYLSYQSLSQMEGDEDEDKGMTQGAKRTNNNITSWKRRTRKGLASTADTMKPGAPKGSAASSPRRIFRRRPVGSQTSASVPYTVSAPLNLGNVSFVGLIPNLKVPSGEGSVNFPLKRLKGFSSLHVRVSASGDVAPGTTEQPRLIVSENPGTEAVVPESDLDKTSMPVDIQQTERSFHHDNSRQRSETDQNPSSDRSMATSVNAGFKLPSLHDDEKSFRIVISQTIGVTEEQVAELHRKPAELLVLHTRVSASVSEANKSRMHHHSYERESNDAMQGMSGDPMTAVEAASRLLGGLLVSSMPTGAPFADSLCTVVAEYLCVLIACPLPPDALESLAAFLNVHDPETSHETHDTPTNALANTREAEWDLDASMKSMVHALAACKGHIFRAQKQNRLSEKLASRIHERTNYAKLMLQRADNSSPTKLNGAMHTALVRAMEERDQAHARLASCNVLHVHETEKHRKQIEQLATQIKVSSDHGGRIAHSADENVTHLPQQPFGVSQENMEREIVSLCQELADEVSGRAEAEMEVARLRETMTIEKQVESEEVDILKREIARLKQELLEEKTRSEAALDELSEWKQNTKQTMDSFHK